MNKFIEFYITGDIDLFLEHFKNPAEFMFRRTSDNKADFFLPNAKVYLYPEIKRILETIKDRVSYKTIFDANDFTKEECDKAELLYFFSTSKDGIGLLKMYDTVYDMWKEPKLNLFSRINPSGLFISTGGGLHLFNEELIEKMKKENITNGINFIPCVIEFEGKEITDWFYGYANNDLGDYDRGEGRFLRTFERARWHGEDFNTSSIYKTNILIVSNKVYRFFNNLTEKQKGSVRFQPVDLC